MCSPLHCTTFSRRRRHSLILCSRNACDSCCQKQRLSFLCARRRSTQWCWSFNVALSSGKRLLPGGATSNSKVSELGYYRHVYYTLALMCAKNRIIIFCGLLDIRENVLLDIRENVEWPHFFGPPCILPQPQMIFGRFVRNFVLVYACFNAPWKLTLGDSNKKYKKI